MLNHKTMGTVSTLAHALAEAGFGVRGIPGTPLGRLITASENPIMDTRQYRPNDYWDVTDAIVKGSTMKQPGENIAYHDKVIQEIVDVAAPALQKEMDQARSLVLPVINQIFEGVGEEVAAKAATVRRHKVEVRYHPAALDNPILASMVDRYSRTAANNSLSLHGFPKLSKEEVAAICKTGVKRLDDDIASLVEGQGDNLENIYQEVFSVRNDSDEVIASATPKFIINLFGFVMAKNLLENELEGYKNSKDRYQRDLSSAVAEFGRRLYVYNETRERNIRRKRLILEMPAPQQYFRPILVNGDIYNQWLKEGGSPELIIGACLRGIVDPTYQDLKDDVYGAIKAFNAHETLVQQEISANKVTTTLSAVKRLLTRHINDAEEDELVTDKASAHAKMAELMKDMTFGVNTDLYSYIRTLVCKVVFPNTSALRILEGIDAQGIENPREAAAIVAIDLVVDWIVSQMELEQ